MKRHNPIYGVGYDYPPMIINPYSFAAAGGSSYETEITAWLAALATAGDTISTGNADAWNAVVAGAKTAGYWASVRALVPLAGPVISAAPVPILGPTPTIVGTFASGDRDTADGFISNGSAYLTTGINNDSTTYFGSDPFNKFYYGLYLTRSVAYTTQISVFGNAFGSGGGKGMRKDSSTQYRIADGVGQIILSHGMGADLFRGVISCRRTTSTAATGRTNSVTGTSSSTASTTTSQELFVFRIRNVGTVINAGTGIGCYFTGDEGVDESHFRGLLDTCFASLT